MTRHEALVALNMVPGLGSVRIQRLLEYCGHPADVFKMSETALCSIEGIGAVCCNAIRQGVSARTVCREFEMIEREGVTLITWEDHAHYPALLRHIYAPPPVLYIKGDITALRQPMLAVVGARRASLYGMRCAERLSAELASQGITVVSGGARGVDSAAHRGVVQAGGMTVAVMGTGLGMIYPAENKDLVDKIISRGCCVSEFPMTMPPDKGNFPRRNRIISGLSHGVIIVEASRRSGALVTATHAVEQGREVFAVPGRIGDAMAQGPNRLIQDGAKLVRCVDDILSECRFTGLPEPLPARPYTDTHIFEEKKYAALSTEERNILTLLNEQPQHIDTIESQAHLEPARLTALLVQLTMKRQVKELPGKLYIKN